MEDKLLKKAVLIKALTGIVLLAYVGYRIYRCAVTSIALAVFPFMISCVVIVLLGFTVAALCEYFSSRRKDAMNLRGVARHLIEGVLLAVFIIIICVVILVAGGFGNSSDRGYVNSDPDGAIMEYLQEERAVTASKADLEQMIAGDFADGNVQYYVMKGSASRDSSDAPVIYVLSITKEKDAYRCQKISADVSLESESVIPVGDFSVHAKTDAAGEVIVFVERDSEQ